MISSVPQLPNLMSRSKGGFVSSCILILGMYICRYLPDLCVYHVVMNNTSLPWTTSPQLIQKKKQPKISPTKQLINFIISLADTVLGDSKYLGIPHSKVPVQLPVVQHETREKKNMFMCAESFFFSSETTCSSCVVQGRTTWKNGGFFSCLWPLFEV